MIRRPVIKYLVSILVVTSLGVTFILFQQARVLFVDETLHFNQILSLARGDYSLNPGLIMFPGYHIIISFAANLGRTYSFFSLRFISFSLNLFLIFLFYRSAKQVDSQNAFIRTFMLIFLPVLFPYLFLLYTDGFSLFSVMLVYYLILNKKYFLSGIAATFSLFIRQNNLFFVLFFFCLIYMEKYGRKFSPVRIKKTVISHWIYPLGIAVFGLCELWSERFGPNSHLRSFSSFSWSSFANIYFLLFISFFLFLPIHLANLRKIYDLLHKKRVILLIIGGFILYRISFFPDHPYNQDLWFLHNRIFIYFSNGILWNILFFLIAVTAALSFAVTRLLKKEYYLIYPVTIFFLLPLKIVEIRYGIIPLTLFILFRENNNKNITVLNAAVFWLLSVFLIWGIMTASFFP